MIWVKCEICGKEVKRYPVHLKNNKKHYCSPECQRKGMKTGKSIKCDYCGKEFYKAKWELKRTKKHYCTKNCSDLDKRIYEYDRDFFHTIDNERKAYWLGFIVADGHVSNYGGRKRLVIGLSHKDEDHLIKFVDDIKIQHSIIKTVDKEFGIVKVVRLHCKEIFYDLRNAGIIPGNKTFTQKPIKLSNHNLQRAFWRGVFDGDGSVGTHYSERSVNELLSVRLFGTKEICQGFKEYMGFKNEVKPHKSIFEIRQVTSKRYLIKKFYDLLYKDATVYLNRKKDIWDKRLNPKLN